MSRRLALVLRRGDLATSTAGALVTSANDSLVGNAQPTCARTISNNAHIFFMALTRRALHGAASPCRLAVHLAA